MGRFDCICESNQDCYLQILKYNTIITTHVSSFNTKAIVY